MLVNTGRARAPSLSRRAGVFLWGVNLRTRAARNRRTVAVSRWPLVPSPQYSGERDRVRGLRHLSTGHLQSPSPRLSPEYWGEEDERRRRKPLSGGAGIMRVTLYLMRLTANPSLRARAVLLAGVVICAATA